LARYAHNHDVAVFFNTGRDTTQADTVRALLVKAGYPVDRLCTRRPSEAVRHSKQRCRASFVADGFTLVANVGNRKTDFIGSGYERAFRLPSYGNQLS
jgi:predicted secreted acid phosphatase